MNKISVIILTKNEEKNIERAIKSVLFADEIIIVDDKSQDETLNKIQMINDPSTILRASKCQSNFKIQIFKHELENDFAAARNWAMEKASNEWVLFLDADEEVSIEMEKQVVALKQSDAQSYYVKRRDFFWGKELKYGETQKARNKGLVRLIKKGSGLWKGKVHEKYVSQYPSVHLRGGQGSFINHYPHPTLKEFIQSVNYYSTLRAEELYSIGKKFSVIELLVFPTAKFILNYFFYLGVFDGPAGFAYAFLMSFHSFLVRVKLYQLQNRKIIPSSI